jgi:hypothetical protein
MLRFKLAVLIARLDLHWTLYGTLVPNLFKINQNVMTYMRISRCVNVLRRRKNA